MGRDWRSDYVGSSLDEIAKEYRLQVARITLKINELYSKQDRSFEDRRKINHLIDIRGQLQETARLLSNYYDVPRESPDAATSYFGGRVKNRDT